MCRKPTCTAWAISSPPSAPASCRATACIYVRGGYGNNDNLVPVDPTPGIQANFAGSDDHPGYSDAQIAEALVADT